MKKHSIPLILPFSAIRAVDLPLVGGKGANLGELTHAGFPIPAGFCLTTLAFEQFIAACPEMDALYDLLDGVDSADLRTTRQVGQQVRETLQSVPIPADIVAAVRDEWQKLGADQPYAVRSSATAEDLPDASFAGQQDTYLNVIGADALLDAIRRCWVSLFTDRAILYRVQNDFSQRDVQLSVIVQQMVLAETSGVLFSVDPLTGHRHTATIDASYGLGEALVSGLVSPDAYRVDKRELSIISKQIADKQIAIYPEKAGGVRQVDLPTAQRSQTVLSDAQIIELAQLGMRVEQHYGTPQDIEWARADGQLYLLQARPITSLYPIDGLESADGSLHIYFSLGHQQMMTNTMSPLGMSTMLTTMPLGHPNQEIETTIARISGGRIFVDLTPHLRHPLMRRLIPDILAQFDALAPEAIKQAMQRPEFKRPHGLSIPFARIIAGLRFGKNVVASLWWRDLMDIAQRANAISAQAVEATRIKLNSIPTWQEQIRATIKTLPTLINPALYWMPTLLASEIAKRLLGRLMHKRVSPDILAAYDLGLPGNVVTEMNLAIGELADIARQSPQLKARFEQLGDNSAAWLTEISKTNDSAPFFAAWEQFIARFGSRGSAEIDIQSLRWYEEPSPLLQVIASYLQKAAGDHRKQHQKLVMARESAVAELLRQAGRGVFGKLRRPLVRRLLHVVHAGSVLREHHKFLLIQNFRTVKELIKQIAEQLVAEKKLNAPDDIWFLRWPELLSLADQTLSDGVALVQKRRANVARYQKLIPPLVITSDGETPVVRYEVADAPDGALVGNPVSAGIVEGIVRVIRDPLTETISKGEILVAPFTDPGWTPLFINAAGLIMEVGGAMTHGSVVAREYGIPAIVGVRGATERLQTGQRVRVDGNRGVIELL